MFLLSFVLEDWAIYELVPSPRHRRATVVLVASSYVTWTYQTHTFSNSLETLLVAWGLVLIRRILENKVRAGCACGEGYLLLGVFVVALKLTGVCSNARPSFPAPFSPSSLWPVSSIELPSLHSFSFQVYNCYHTFSASEIPSTYTMYTTTILIQCKTKLPRSNPRLRGSLRVNSNLYRHPLLPTLLDLPLRHPQPNHHPSKQPPLQLQHLQPSHPRPPPTPPALYSKPPPTPRPSLHRHGPLPLPHPPNTHLASQCPRRLRPLRNPPPLHLPPPRTTLPNPLRAPTAQLHPRTPLAHLPRRMDHLQRGHGLPHGRVPPRRHRPRPARHAYHRVNQHSRPRHKNTPRRLSLLVENLLPTTMAPRRR